MQQITVRYRASVKTNAPAFSAQNFRALSLAPQNGAAIPEGFADLELPVTGATLAQAVYLSGAFETPALCSGLGKCGLCRMRFISDPPAALEIEKTVLSHHDIDAGWRLACRHAPQNGMHVLIPALPAISGPASSGPTNSRQDATGRALSAVTPASLAVDLGTTSIHWRFVAPGHAPEKLPRGVMVNPQMGAGSDVISRLAYAASGEGAKTLRRLALNALHRIIREGEAQGFTAESLCVAANPTMTAILLGQNLSTLSHAPYSLPEPGGTTQIIPGLPPVYAPPHVSPFVGSDISAGYAAVALDPEKRAPEFPFLLADLGTNGECVLAVSPGRAFAASLPMGPALEGINLTYGTVAAPGAVTDFALTPYGLEPKVLGDTAPTGVTATGYLSLLRILRASNLLGEDGLFTHPKSTLGQRISGERGTAGHAASGHNPGGHGAGGPSIRLPGKMRLFASDVEEILKVKAAFTLAVSRLLGASCLAARDVKCVYLAGSLGEHAPVNALTELGFLPAVLGPRIVFAGNTALLGATLLLEKPELRNTLAAWASAVHSLDLANDPAFGAAFAEHMVFAWKNRELQNGPVPNSG